MAILTIGRVGMDVVLGHPSEMTEERSLDGGRNLVLRGWLMAGTLTETKALRSELIEQLGQLVAVTYTLDTAIECFAVPTDVRIENVLGSYRGAGAFRFEISMIRIGTDARVELQSLLTGAGVTNAHSEAGELWWAAPPGALAISTGATVVTEHTRDSEDGPMGVFLGVSTDDDPTWSIAPSNYYDSAVKVYTHGRLRAGQDVHNAPSDWELSNGIIRIRPQVYQGSSNGFWDLNFHNGTGWGATAIPFKIKWANTTDIPAWHYMTIMRNTAEMAVIRLVRDAATAPPSADRHVLDFCLRRGAPFVSCYYTYTGVVGQHAVARSITDAATLNGSYLQDVDTISGHRWVMGTPMDFIYSTVNGLIAANVAAQTFPFFLGAAIDDAANGSKDGPEDIANQYHGWMSETVRAIRR